LKFCKEKLKIWNLVWKNICQELVSKFKSRWKSTIFWDIMPCSLVEIHWYFQGVYYLCLQGGRVSWARNQQEVGGKKSVACWFLVCLTLRTWRWRQWEPYFNRILKY
jgi:hypothetical protein